MTWTGDEPDDLWEWGGDELPRRSLELMFDEVALRLYWTAASGITSWLDEMETSHIENIMRASIDGRLKLDKHTADRFEIELAIRRRLNHNT